MSRTLMPVILLLVAGNNGGVWATDLSPQDFAYGMPIRTSDAAVAYRVSIPFEVYTQIVHEDLRDLRVFNAEGKVVPYELQPAPPMPATQSDGPNLPLFPLPADARATLDGMRITIRSQGTAVDMETGTGVASFARSITNYVLDTREADTPLSGLQLHWAEDAQEFSGSIRVESSDDLGDWRLVTPDLPVLNLHASGAALVQGRLTFPPTQAKFWRLTWVGKTAPFILASVTGVTTTQQAHDITTTVLIPGKATSAGATFDLGAKIPVTQVNLLLPQANSVMKLELLSRPRATDGWHTVATGEFYRVTKDSTEHRNEPIRIGSNTDRFWLARQSPASGTLDDIKLEATWNTMDVVFLAQGRGPFVLAYGSASSVSSSVPLESLLKGVRVPTAQLSPSYPLGGAARLAPTVPWRMAVLWVVLGVGIALLSWMAYRLSRELRPTKPPERRGS